MGLTPAALLADAWAMLRRDRAVLLGIAGALWFLPTFALILLVPGPPLPVAGMEPASPEAQRYVEQLTQWFGTSGAWYLARAVIDAWATASVYALYLDRSTPDVRGALELGVGLLPRFMLLSMVVGLVSLGGLALYVLPGIWVLARLIAAGPTLVAERPLGALAALGRGWRLSRGAALALIGPVGIALAMGWLVPQPFLLLDRWLRARPGGVNVAALATADALAAAGETAAAIASALIAIAAYRRLVSRGQPPSGGPSR
ncbi:hypothetical protein [Sphingomonas sp.]|uniref:hypothetical protein n=1 Tax=Sphingomonas sp. TaxID=28214 RepID=UPI003B00F0FD